MGPIHHIKGILDRKAYLDILKKVMLPHARRALGQGSTFQEDNDPKHRSSDVQQWFRRRRITRLDWPSQSPDLNIIEPLWNEPKKRLAGKLARNVDEKFAQIKEEWSNIPQTTIDRLIESMQMSGCNTCKRLCY
ncbi:hypothetical protein ANCCAN_20055 [Ancylostoma caninum]|uniref:Tc1-like transposase DDE domain-containing protein n=1 Tax=Ancylostoma caninum TaxID=29170 RepID=A0A368FTI3_ANCCA|nr:hypothetical protein ANCCAN_20055 [Ancylostoma caninum]